MRRPRAPRRLFDAARVTVAGAALVLAGGCGGSGDSAVPPTTLFSTTPPPAFGTDPASLPEITTTTGLEAGDLPAALDPGLAGGAAATPARRGTPTTAAPRSATVGTPTPSASGGGGATTSTAPGRTTSAAATLSPGEVTPPPGDPRGSGTAAVTVDTAAGQVCVELTVRGVVSEPDGAHIHRGPRGSAGEVVATLPVPPTTGSVRGCVRPDARVLAEMDREPALFYVDVHTRTHPGGAVRGQLARA